MATPVTVQPSHHQPPAVSGATPGSNNANANASAGSNNNNNNNNNNNTLSIDTQHEDLVHDVQMDFYGAKLASCSSDRTIKICNVSDGSYEVSATLQGHEGPVWQVSWAHPKFGVLLASCSFDGSVLIHRETRPREWTILHAAKQLHESSVNAVAFAPHEYGLMLAAASSDGRVSILQHDPSNQTWIVDYLQDCPLGVNAVSWAPADAYYAPINMPPPSEEGTTDPAAQEQQAQQAPAPATEEAPLEPMLVTAGCDNGLRFWKRNAATLEWTQQGVPQCRSAADGSPTTTTTTSATATTATTPSHRDWVRDVAWSHSLVPNHSRIASAGQDGQVLIWTQATPRDEWTATVLKQFDSPVWRVSWSATGHVLAVSSGDDTVSLFKEGLVEGTWIPMEMEPTTKP